MISTATLPTLSAGTGALCCRQGTAIAHPGYHQPSQTEEEKDSSFGMTRTTGPPLAVGLHLVRQLAAHHAYQEGQRKDLHSPRPGKRARGYQD